MLRYKEVKQMLAELIADKRNGDRLPSRISLNRQLDSSRATIDKAIRELTEEGMLESRFGSGTYVAQRLDGVVSNQENWCLIVPDISEAVSAQFASGVEKEASARGANVILCSSDGRAEKQAEYIQRLMMAGVDGFLIVPAITRSAEENIALYRILCRSQIPFVFCNRDVEGIDAPIVKSNDFYGGYIATQYLIALGYRRIVFLSRQRYRTNNPGFKVAALYTPVLHEGDTREFGQVTAPGAAGGSVSISSQCKNIEAACRFLDYFWTEEGGKFASLGTEGVSYETVDGHPQFTKLVAENPDGLSFAAARNLFSRVTWPHLHNDLDVYDTNETLREMVEVWSDTNMLAHLYPAITPTVEESDAITSTYTTIDTYCKEMIVKFIIGMEPMDRYDAFVDQLKALGIKEVLTVRQAMYDRFLAR